MITTTYREEQGLRVELRNYNDRDNTILFRRVDANGKALSGYETFSEEALASRINMWLNPTKGSLRGSVRI
jgi:hypothetical protein